MVGAQRPDRDLRRAEFPRRPARASRHGARSAGRPSGRTRPSRAPRRRARCMGDRAPVRRPGSTTVWRGHADDGASGSGRSSSFVRWREGRGWRRRHLSIVSFQRTAQVAVVVEFEGVVEGHAPVERSQGLVDSCGPLPSGGPRAPGLPGERPRGARATLSRWTCLRHAADRRRSRFTGSACRVRGVARTIGLSNSRLDPAGPLPRGDGRPHEGRGSWAGAERRR
jgi:hypothetical protein